MIIIVIVIIMIIIIILIIIIIIIIITIIITIIMINGPSTQALICFSFGPYHSHILCIIYHLYVFYG